MSVTELEGCESPGNFTHCSRSFVWSSPELNIGIHIVPFELTHEQLQLGTITRATYHTLETVGAMDSQACFVMLHYVPSTKNVHVTMLPVGDDDIRNRMDAELKSGKDGFNNLLERVKAKILSGYRSKPNGVFILYNAPGDLDTPSKVVIVHELGSDPGDALCEFTEVIGGHS